MSEGTRLVVTVKPRSAKAGLSIKDGTVIVRVHAPPADGEANEAVREEVASFFGVSKSSVVIVRGETSRHKELVLHGLSAGAVEEKLKTLSAS